MNSSMSSKINLFDRIQSNFSAVVAVLVILCYSLFLATSFISVGNAQQGITTTKVNVVSTKVTAANSNSTPSVNMLSYKVNLTSSKAIPTKNAMQLPQSLLLSYTVTNTQGVSSERVLSANNNNTSSSNSANYNVLHVQRISNAP
jgi:hypothetical protein